MFEVYDLFPSDGLAVTENPHNPSGWAWLISVDINGTTMLAEVP